LKLLGTSLTPMIVHVRFMTFSPVGLTRHKISDRETCKAVHEQQVWMANAKARRSR
jgi:hypothetical protein